MSKFTPLLIQASKKIAKLVFKKKCQRLGLNILIAIDDPNDSNSIGYGTIHIATNQNAKELSLAPNSQRHSLDKYTNYDALYNKIFEVLTTSKIFPRFSIINGVKQDLDELYHQLVKEKGVLEAYDIIEQYQLSNEIKINVSADLI